MFYTSGSAQTRNDALSLVWVLVEVFGWSISRGTKFIEKQFKTNNDIPIQFAKKDLTVLGFHIGNFFSF